MTPFAPKAGPIGGEGLAFPAGMASLMYPATANTNSKVTLCNYNSIKDNVLFNVLFAAMTVTLREEATKGTVFLRECPMNLDPFPLMNEESTEEDVIEILCGIATTCLLATTFIVRVWYTRVTDMAAEQFLSRVRYECCQTL